MVPVQGVASFPFLSFQSPFTEWERGSGRLFRSHSLLEPFPSHPKENFSPIAARPILPGDRQQIPDGQVRVCQGNDGFARARFLWLWPCKPVPLK